MIIEQSNNELKLGMTFSDGLSIFKDKGDKNLFEEIITVSAIEEDENLSDEYKSKLISILNRTDVGQFEKRIMVMRSLDKDKEFSSQIGLILKDRPSKMDMVKRIMLVFRDHYTKNDVLKKEFGEVLTGISTVKSMISEIDKEFWNSPYNDDGSIKRILEPANGSGIFLWMVIYKFMVGLESYFKDENARYKFIVENMIYACELQKSKMFNWLCIADIYDEYDLNVYCGSFLEEDFDKHMKEVWGLNPGDFSLCLSNPPYQEMDGGAKASAKPIYNLFTLKSIGLSKQVLFITPSRWFAGGKGLDKYRKFMMESNKVRVIRHFDDVSKIFGKNVDIPGGVSYFLFDNNYNGDCSFNNTPIGLNKLDIIIKDKNSLNLIEKVSKFENISKISNPRSYFGISTNFSDIENEKISNDYIKCYFSKNKGFDKFVNRKYVKNLDNLFRICTPRANGNYPNFGNLFLINPNECVSDSYISFYTKTENEANSLLSYLKTKFANYFLSLRKISQTIKPDTCKWIPLVPFDREWTDEKLFEYFNLTDEEIKLILEK